MLRDTLTKLHLRLQSLLERIGLPSPLVSTRLRWDGDSLWFIHNDRSASPGCALLSQSCDVPWSGGVVPCMTRICFGPEHAWNRAQSELLSPAWLPAWLRSGVPVRKATYRTTHAIDLALSLSVAGAPRVSPDQSHGQTRVVLPSSDANAGSNK